MSIPSLVEGTGNNEARRVPNETNRRPPVPTLRRVVRKFGFRSSCIPPVCLLGARGPARAVLARRRTSHLS